MSAIARAHGGWASAANQPGGGAVAGLQLPGTVYQPASMPSPGTVRPRTDDPATDGIAMAGPKMSREYCRRLP